MLKHLLVSLILLTPAAASADDPAQANRLLVEAAKIIKTAETAQEAQEQLSLLEDALGKLNEIIERHPSSDLAVKLATDQPIGSLSLPRLRHAINSLRAENARRQRTQVITDSRDEETIQSYLGLVFQKLESHKRYPRVAERSGLNGRVVLRFTVRWDGEVLNPEVVEVTGHDSFRQAALQALRRVGQLPNFPDGIERQELLIEIPLTFDLRNR